MAQVMNMPSLDTLRDWLKRLERPDWVRGIELAEGSDADGDPALWVWIVLDADIPTQDIMQPVLLDLRQRIKAYLSSEVPGLWAYVRVRETPHGDDQEA
jgi:hypothetical protein